MELSTERAVGMGVGSIPVSKVWEYIDRFSLPDWWEPVLLQCDCQIVSKANKSDGDGSATKPKNNTISGEGRDAVRSG